MVERAFSQLDSSAMLSKKNYNVQTAKRGGSGVVEGVLEMDGVGAPSHMLLTLNTPLSPDGARSFAILSFLFAMLLISQSHNLLTVFPRSTTQMEIVKRRRNSIVAILATSLCLATGACHLIFQETSFRLGEGVGMGCMDGFVISFTNLHTKKLSHRALFERERQQLGASMGDPKSCWGREGKLGGTFRFNSSSAVCRKAN